MRCANQIDWAALRIDRRMCRACGAHVMREALSCPHCGCGAMESRPRPLGMSPSSDPRIRRMRLLFRQNAGP